MLRPGVPSAPPYAAQDGHYLELHAHRRATSDLCRRRRGPRTGRRGRRPAGRHRGTRRPAAGRSGSVGDRHRPRAGGRTALHHPLPVAQRDGRAQLRVRVRRGRVGRHAHGFGLGPLLLRPPAGQGAGHGVADTVAPGHRVLALPGLADLLGVGGVHRSRRGRECAGVRAGIAPLGEVLRPRVVHRRVGVDGRLRRRALPRHRGGPGRLRHRGIRRGTGRRHRVLLVDRARSPG